ncbi:HNH endonuclease [Actinomyces bowdenii]|uniref:HNH endonuclease n=1 Tax=Actinomyces bowdenii TaxID=131109 RepID=UPI0035A39C56
MATSRTGTGKWRNIRTAAITRARNADQRTCLECGRILLWDTHGLPASPEADHIVPHARGGKDALDNVRIICRACNLQKGDGRRKKPKPPRRRRRIKTTKTTPWEWPD